MPSVVVQMGHVARTRGATGTVREQEFTRTLGPRVAELLAGRGLTVHLIGADERVPDSDVFIALHTDGSTRPERRGASVGYPDAAGGRLAAAWKRAHQRRGFPGGYLPDNYTAALRGYYGFSRSGSPVRFLAEHGTTTNEADRTWLFDNIEACALAHHDAVCELLGLPFDLPAGPAPVAPPAPAQPPAAPTPAPATNGEPDVRTLDLRGVTRDGRTHVRGGGVRALQRLLRITDDGIAGTQTRGVLLDAQHRHKLDADAIYGPRTASALLAE